MVRRFDLAGPMLMMTACVAVGPPPPSPPPAEQPSSSLCAVTVESSALSPRFISTPREDHVERIHGVEVSDPYRWLEAGESPRVRGWVEAQNELLERTLARLPLRRELGARLEQLLETTQLGRPSMRPHARGWRYFYTRRDGSEDQPRLLSRDGPGGAERVLIDPNRLSASGTLALDWFEPSNDGALVAYGLSQGGTEDSTLHVMDVAAGRDLPDQISRTRLCSIAWSPDGTSFFYTRYPAPGSVPAGEEFYGRRVYRHALGRDPEADPLVFAPASSTDFPGTAISPDGRWLVVSVHQGWTKNELYLADTTRQSLEFERITTGLDAQYLPLVLDDVLYVVSDEGHPRKALFAADPAAPSRERWSKLIDQHPTDLLASLSAARGQLLVGWMHAATSRLERFDRRGRSLGEVKLPAIGASDGFGSWPSAAEAVFDFESFMLPRSIHRVDLVTGAATSWLEATSPVSATDFVVERDRAISRDGTEVPFLVVRGKTSDPRSGDNPTLLYGYGGFDVSLQPRFLSTGRAFLERGGVYVQANLRGGGEFGDAWHRAGQLGMKQRVFDDFIAVAERLIATGVTRPERLGILGRSNGGLLVAAAVTQRPELFAAAVAAVPLADMLRYHRFLLARLWIPEYGDPEDPEAFDWLRAYSPYHHVREGTRYPAVLLTTAAGDSRVSPMHAHKLAAALQHATSSDRPILLFTETGAGHGAGKPRSKLAREYADIYAFLLWQLGVVAAPG